MAVAERVNISIPEELYKRLQTVKDKLNVSGLCQEAIERAVRLEEIKISAAPVKEKAIQRLKLEREKTEEDWFETGKTDGYADAADSSYDQFIELVNLYKSKDELERYGVWLQLDAFSSDLQDHLQEKMANYDPKPIDSPYLAGWMEGMMDFWDEIKDEL